MKKITITLTDESERFFNEIIYSLPKETDGSGMCTQSEAINYALLRLQIFENIYDFPGISEKEIDEYILNKASDISGIGCKMIVMKLMKNAIYWANKQRG